MTNRTLSVTGWGRGSQALWAEGVPLILAKLFPPGSSSKATLGVGVYIKFPPAAYHRPHALRLRWSREGSRSSPTEHYAPIVPRTTDFSPSPIIEPPPTTTTTTTSAVLISKGRAYCRPPTQVTERDHDHLGASAARRELPHPLST